MEAIQIASDSVLQVVVDGTGFAKGEFPHTLHPVITAESVYYLLPGQVSTLAPIDGSASHTHDPIYKLKGWSWTYVVSGQTLDAGPGISPKLNCTFGEGVHTVALTIYDETSRSLTATHTFVVTKLEKVPGACPPTAV